MLVRVKYLNVILIAFCALLSLGSYSCFAQSSVADFHNILQEKLTFDTNDLAALERGQAIVKVLPVDNKREVAVSGLVRLQVPGEIFLDSFRESMAKKANPAILEIGMFSNQPQLDDLKDLTFETRDIEDLKSCVVGDCQLKLSASMIERLQKEIDWDQPNYASQATQLLKSMLLDYVRDYLKRGDVALIEYSDKGTVVRVAEEQRALRTTSTYINDVLRNIDRSTLTNVENAIVWSKIKFGLKPVLAINHIVIYQNQTQSGAQVLIESKQIYANHYFNSSLALTAFVSVPGANPESYLVYENRSRSDSLGGPFGKLKRGMVEDKAARGLTSILEQSRLPLSSHTEPETVTPVGRNWRRWKAGLIFCVFLGAAVAALFALKVAAGKLKAPEKRPA